jgi:hypothetical protein
VSGSDRVQTPAGCCSIMPTQTGISRKSVHLAKIRIRADRAGGTASANASEVVAQEVSQDLLLHTHHCAAVLAKPAKPALHPMPTRDEWSAPVATALQPARSCREAAALQLTWFRLKYARGPAPLR